MGYRIVAAVIISVVIVSVMAAWLGEKNLEKICKNCKWFEETDEIITEPDGWCFRMPHTEPKGENERCGEFEVKE